MFRMNDDLVDLLKIYIENGWRRNLKKIEQAGKLYTSEKNGSNMLEPIKPYAKQINPPSITGRKWTAENAFLSFHLSLFWFTSIEVYLYRRSSQSR